MKRPFSFSMPARLDKAHQLEKPDRRLQIRHADHGVKIFHGFFSRAGFARDRLLLITPPASSGKPPGTHGTARFGESPGRQCRNRSARATQAARRCLPRSPQARLLAAKLVAGAASGSLALLSEGAHNGLDIGASALTLFAVREADKPADDEHPFGHAKIEAVAALAETGFLARSRSVAVHASGSSAAARAPRSTPTASRLASSSPPSRSTSPGGARWRRSREKRKRRAQRRCSPLFKRSCVLAPRSGRSRCDPVWFRLRRRPGGDRRRGFHRHRQLRLGRHTIDALVDTRAKGPCRSPALNDRKSAGRRGGRCDPPAAKRRPHHRRGWNIRLSHIAPGARGRH